MNENKMLQQITAVFSLFMVMFYIGVGSFFLFFFDQSPINKSARMILGSAFLLYGIFRAFRSYIQIKDIFFNKENDND